MNGSIIRKTGIKLTGLSANVPIPTGQHRGRQRSQMTQRP